VIWSEDKPSERPNRIQDPEALSSNSNPLVFVPTRMRPPTRSKTVGSSWMGVFHSRRLSLRDGSNVATDFDVAHHNADPTNDIAVTPDLREAGTSFRLFSSCPVEPSHR